MRIIRSRIMPRKMRIIRSTIMPEKMRNIIILEKNEDYKKQNNA